MRMGPRPRTSLSAPTASTASRTRAERPPTKIAFRTEELGDSVILLSFPLAAARLGAALGWKSGALVVARGGYGPATCCSPRRTMMLALDDLPSLALLARVIHHRSFSAAAREAGIAKSAVSRRIARLE